MRPEEKIQMAVENLSQSEVGKEALKTLHHWFRKGRGLSLDSSNIEAVSLLLSEAWGSHAGTTLEYLDSAVSSEF